MKVFLSWSGPESRQVAEALHDWLPNVIQQLRPWMSSTDLVPGVRWPIEVGKELEASSFGIVCLTPNNRVSPWILFEAGALGKKLSDARVVPYLLRLQRDEVSGPLSQFQNVEATEEGTRDLVNSLYASLPEAALDGRLLSRAFDKWWPDLRNRLDGIQSVEPEPESLQRPQEDLLGEILGVVRGLQRDVAMVRNSAPQAAVHWPKSFGQARESDSDAAATSKQLSERVTKLCQDLALAKHRVPFRSLSPELQRSLLAQATELLETRNVVGLIGLDLGELFGQVSELA